MQQAKAIEDKAKAQAAAQVIMQAQRNYKASNYNSELVSVLEAIEVNRLSIDPKNYGKSASKGEQLKQTLIKAQQNLQNNYQQLNSKEQLIADSLLAKSSQLTGLAIKQVTKAQSSEKLINLKPVEKVGGTLKHVDVPTIANIPIELYKADLPKSPSK
jgi:hypothetical protein